ncbi:MAG TPA: alpha/beta fold hydrolase [Myxococcota bacterium]|nr:alpha/beta fold hydrolase [Myxococcota bacterium]
MGPHPVGVRTVEIVDPLRPDRPLLTEIWYPAAEGTTGEGESYGMGAEELAALAGDDWAWLLALMGGDDDLLTLVETIAVRDAAEAEHDPNRGLVLFSHGYRGVRYQSTFLTTYLASHGYVVAAPDHVGNTMFDGSATDDEAVADRMLDMVYLSEALEDVVDTEPGRVAWIGHSFGASTVLMAGAMDNSEMVGISLAPAFDERMAGVYELRSALLVLGGTADGTCPIEQQELAWERTVAPRCLGELDDMRHFDFTDLCANALFAYGITSFVEQLEDACGEDPTAYHATVQAVSTAMLDRYLACDDSTDLAGLDADYLVQWLGDDADYSDEGSPSPKSWPTLPASSGELLGWPVFGTGTPEVVFVGGLVDATVFGEVIGGHLRAVDVDDALDAAPEVPVLLLHGEHDDAVLIESSRYLADTLPDPRLEVFQRSGHLLMLDEPELFDLRLSEFIEETR